MRLVGVVFAVCLLVCLAVPASADWTKGTITTVETSDELVAPDCPIVDWDHGTNAWEAFASAWLPVVGETCEDESHNSHTVVSWAQCYKYLPWDTDDPLSEEPGDGTCEADGPGHWLVQETAPAQAWAWHTCNTGLAGQLGTQDACERDTAGEDEDEVWQSSVSVNEGVYDMDKAKVWANVQAKVVGGGYGDVGWGVGYHWIQIDYWGSHVWTD